MGYTHYWTDKPKFPKRIWDKLFLPIVKSIIDVADSRGVAIRFEMSEPNKPARLDSEVVRFNGVGDNGYETFVFARKDVNQGGWFCKTGFVKGRAYDTYVVATLAAASMIFGQEKVGFGSDSGDDTHMLYAGVDVFMKAFDEAVKRTHLNSGGYTAIFSKIHQMKNRLHDYNCVKDDPKLLKEYVESLFYGNRLKAQVTEAEVTA